MTFTPRHMRRLAQPLNLTARLEGSMIPTNAILQHNTPTEARKRTEKQHITPFSETISRKDVYIAMVLF